MTVERKRVVVIGAGIAGLVTAKVLRDDGFDVTAFEKEPVIGGVWAESRTYPGLRANNSRRSYAFSDHPYDRSADVFPTADQVRRYLASYVAWFGLAPLIRLSTEVVGVSRRGAGFEVAVRGPDGPACLVCDFVVVCAGTFSEPTGVFYLGGHRAPLDPVAACRPVASLCLRRPGPKRQLAAARHADGVSLWCCRGISRP